MTTLALRGIANWKLDDRTRTALESFFGVGRQPRQDIASDMSLRHVVGLALINQLIGLAESNPRLRFYSVTFIEDRLRTTDLRTEIRIERLGKTVRDILRDHGISDWIGVVEFQPYKNWTAGVGREIAPHVHVLFWRESNLRSRKLQSKLRASKRFVSLSQAPTVTLNRRRTVGDVAHAAAYLLKGPERAKNAFKAKNGRDVHLDAACRNDLAVRVMEILSQLRLSELLLSSGTARAMRVELLREIRGYVAQHSRTRRQADLMMAGEIADLWLSARTQAKKTAYQPVVIRRDQARV